MIRCIYPYFILVLFIAIGCTSTQSTAYNYENNIGIMMHPQFMIYHHAESQSRLYFQIDTDEILYVRNNSNEPFQSNLKIEYKIYIEGEKEFLDTGSLLVSNSYLQKKEKFIDTLFHFDFEANKKGSMELKLVDQNRSREHLKKIKLDKLNLYNKQFFLLTDSIGYPKYNNRFTTNETININSNFSFNNDIYCLKNNTVFPFPLPPFSKSAQPIFPKKTSYAEKLSFDSQRSISYEFPVNGFVYFQGDTLSDNGFALFNFHEDYPYLTDPDNLIYPLRYLSTKEEYQQILKAENSKEAVDKFWLNKVTSRERARTLIRTYYSRVQLANELFTSHIEGWKTDRGLINIIFGPPNFVRNNKNQEVWIYGDENNMNALKFTFEKKTNPFSENDYVLKRNYSYKTPWYRAVETWRNGKVYIVQ